MNIVYIVILVTILIVDCHKNVTETDNDIISILNKCRSNRQPRCVKFEKVGNYVQNTLRLIERTKGFGDFLNSLNVSQCSVNKDSEYIRNHILNGLIIHENLPETHWHEYKTVHRKQYETPRHELIAMSKWRNNLQRVAQHNRDFLNGQQSYSLHLNHLGDLDVREYFRKFLKLLHTFPLFDPAEDHHKTTFRKNKQSRVPTHFDWRSKGFRPRFEQQNDCGACYAFAVTHALQAQLFKKHASWGELSPQQIVDCSFKDGNKGCDGGSIRAALRYAARDGLIKESQYPYTGKQGHCKYKAYPVRVRARRWATLPAHDEKAIEKALVTIGPLAVALNAAPFTFQLYRSGIYDDIFCAPWILNHAMLLVGYTPDYWILLNWWGKNWGEDGYIRLRRGWNRCGVTNMATYVEL